MVNVKRLLGALLAICFIFSTSACSLIPDTALSRNSRASSNGTVLEDSRGQWQQVQLQDSNDIYKEANQALAVPEGVSTNLSEQEMHSAIYWVIKFVSSEGIDSIAADSTSGWETWKRDVAPTYIDAQYLSKVLAKPKNLNTISFGKTDRSLVIMNSVNRAMDGLLVRGQQRVTNMGFEGPVSAVASEKDRNAVTIHGTIYATYKVEDSATLAYTKKSNPILNDEEIRVTAPKLFDGNPGKAELDLSFAYTVLKQADGTWKIIDYENFCIFSTIVNQ